MDIFYDAWSYLQQGGVIMVPMIALSMGLWVLIVERLMFFRNMEKRGDTPGRNWELNGCVLPPSSACGLCAPVIRELIRQRSGDARLDSRILEQHAIRQKMRLSQSLNLIAALSAAAPLLGLYGTVTGMIGTFEAITFFGTGNANALAEGIAEALVTTQSGLLVGIPGLFMARLLSQRAKKLLNRLEETVMAARRCLS